MRTAMPLKVYYLDDETDLLEAIRDSFESESISISTFSSPQHFLELLKSSPPDVVLVDYRLPGTTGDIVAKQIPSHIPRALLTGDISVDCETQFDLVIQKPCKMEIIEKFLQDNCQKLQLKRAA